MPTYTYGCENKAHPRQENIVHGFHDNPDIRCEVCGGPMHRIPQPLRMIDFHTAGDTLTAWMSKNYWNLRAGKPEFSPFKVRHPEGTPGRDFHTR